MPVAQNATSPVAARQTVVGARKHFAPPVYTVHAPPHTFCERLLQYVTVISPAACVDSALGGVPMKVSSASVVASQCFICSKLST